MVQFEASLPITDAGGNAHYLKATAIEDIARIREEDGYAALVTAETNTDPFLALVPASSATSKIELGTSVAIALARSPMTVAYTAHQLQFLSQGRFCLGLGSQIRPHITRRFGMPWENPVGRMGAHIEAIRAIWKTWREGNELSIKNKFFTIDLMTPGFVPPSHGHADPPILISAVGEQMTRLAARKADGIITHPFASADYFAATTLPAITAELDRYDRDRSNFRITGAVMTATGSNDKELGEAVDALRQRIAFYGSTPSYRPVLEHHGHGALGDQLHGLSRSSDPERWTAMARLVPDELLDAIGIVGSPEYVHDEAVRRYDGLVDRLRGDLLFR